jgi:hypothetical protein
VVGLLGDQRDRLDPRRPGADDRDPLAGEVDVVMRPAGRVEGGAGERAETRDFRQLRRRQDTRGEDEEPRFDGLAAVGRHPPAARALVPPCPDDAGVELDVAAQPEAISDVVGVAQYLGLGGVALRPVPLLLELGRERVGVVERLDVAACAGIAVPPPRATDVAGRLEATDVESESLEAVDRVHPGEPGADDDHVEAIHDEILPWR